MGLNTVEGAGPAVDLHPSDPSVLVPHLQNTTSLTMPLFEGLAGMSRSNYNALRELLTLIKAENGETHPEIFRLQMTLDSIFRSRGI